MRVRFNWRYQSGLGTWGAGAVDDITTALYDALLRDSPGVVSVADDPILRPADDATAAPARQVKAARNRQQRKATGDR